MNKFKLWLIHKLGGVEKDLSVETKTVSTYTSPTKICCQYTYPKSFPSDAVKKSIAESIGKDLLHKGFINFDITEMGLPNGVEVEYKAEVYVFKKE